MSVHGIYLYEFLYRGRAVGSDGSPAYHVVLAQDTVDAFGNTSTVTSHAMTAAEAADKGFDLPAIVASINADTMAENLRLKAELVALQTKIDAIAAPAERVVESA